MDNPRSNDMVPHGLKFGYERYNVKTISKSEKKRICGYFTVSDLHKITEADLRFKSEELIDEINGHDDWILESIVWDAKHKVDTNREGLNTILEKAGNNEFDILLLHHVSLISLQCGKIFDYVLQLYMLNKSVYGIVDNIHSFDELAESIPLTPARKKQYEKFKKSQSEPKIESEPRQQNVPKISVGYTVGKLTVTERLPERKNGYSYWRCACKCGGEMILDTRTLQRRTVKDCGCETRVKPGQRDLTGTRFGKLVCLEPTEERGNSGGVVWRCQCDCGNTCLAVNSQLINGYKKSCGCVSHPLLKDFVGKRFNKLEVIGYAGKRAGMHRWLCKCDCGNETVVGQTLLQSGKTKSCGCLQETIILDNLQLYEGTSVTLLESASKGKLLITNKSGHRGVFRTPNGKWCAQITFKRKTYHLGTFNDIEDAVKARKHGEEMHEDFLEWYYANVKNNKEKGEMLGE